MKKIVLFLSIIVLAGLVRATDVPTFISYQGKLANRSTGNPFTNVSFQINITTLDNLSDVKWGPYNFSNVTDSNGVFDLILGRNYQLNLTAGKDYQLVVAIDLDAANFSSAHLVFGDESPTGDEIIINAGGPSDATELVMKDNVTSVQVEFTKYAKLTGANFTGQVNMTANLSLADRLTFGFGEFIDNLVNNWVKVTGNLNVSENIRAKNATFENLNVTGTSYLGNLEISASQITVDTVNALTKYVNIPSPTNISGGLNVSNGLIVNSGNVGIGTASPDHPFSVAASPILIGQDETAGVSIYLGQE
ncbi:MAG: hypothetical protein QF362_01930, partial [Candidatus Woesearchaeota archaeon]|nr:hypothetical protein [Candidatus Woesearchaeota archaeon]